MLKSLMIILIVGIAILAGCVGPTPPEYNHSNYSANYTEQPADVPMPGEEQLGKGEPPEFPFQNETG